MAILIDDPRWPAHGRLWAHLVSDASLDELHAFAAANGIPRRGFDRDHYDVPDEAHARLVAAGARHCGRAHARAGADRVRPAGHGARAPRPLTGRIAPRQSSVGACETGVPVSAAVVTRRRDRP